MSVILLPIIIIVVIALVVIVCAIVMYNGLVSQRNRVAEAFSTMDVYLKKRFDLVPNLVETVKGSANYEAQTLDNVVRARGLVQSAGSAAERLEGEAQLTGTLRSLFSVAESYPNLKANSNFLALQSDLGHIEDDIANARKYYNAVVREYNTKTETFPGVVIANMFRFEKKPSYELADSGERENVKVGF